MLTYQDLLEKEFSLKSILKTNYGENACSIHPIKDVEAAYKDAIGQILVREMHIVKHHRNGYKDWQESIDRIYIWADGDTSKIPERFSQEITSWVSTFSSYPSLLVQPHKFL